MGNCQRFGFYPEQSAALETSDGQDSSALGDSSATMEGVARLLESALKIVQIAIDR